MKAKAGVYSPHVISIRQQICPTRERKEREKRRNVPGKSLFRRRRWPDLLVTGLGTLPASAPL
jgi:hypothetical protein